MKPSLVLSVMVAGREGRVGPHCQSQQFPLGVLSIYLVMVRAGEEKIAKVIVGVIQMKNHYLCTMLASVSGAVWVGEEIRKKE